MQRKTLPKVIAESDAIEGELTEMQQAFVDAYVSNGGQLKAAAITAGYASASAQQRAGKLIRNPVICQAIYQATIGEIARHAPAALASMAGLSRSAKSELVKMQASADLLDRAGFKPIDRRQVQLQGDLQVSIDLS